MRVISIRMVFTNSIMRVLSTPPTHTHTHTASSLYDCNIVLMHVLQVLFSLYNSHIVRYFTSFLHGPPGRTTVFLAACPPMCVVVCLCLFVPSACLSVCLSVFFLLSLALNKIFSTYMLDLLIGHDIHSQPTTPIPTNHPRETALWRGDGVL